MKARIRLGAAALFFFASPFAGAAEDVYGQVSLYVMPAYPVKMNWGNPAGLLWSALEGVVFNGALTVGHVSVEVNCGMRDGAMPTDGPQSDFHVLTSAVDVNDPSSDLLLKKQVGFSLLERSWTGRVETPAQVHGSIKITNGKPKQFSLVTFLIPETSCRRLTQYFKEYAATPKLYYGNSPRPRRKEGAGCTAFGVSFLELAGVMTEEFRREWAVTVRVPLHLMAGYEGRKKVSVLEILTSGEGREWARPGEPAMTLETYEPRLMHDWIVNLVNSPQELRALGGEIDRRLPHEVRGIPAIRIDRRSTPTPTEPIFLGPPALKVLSDGTVIRADKTVAVDGSFEVRP